MASAPTGAFGVSQSGGFGFTLNWVGPNDAVCPGIGRGFVSRASLDASDFEAAKGLIIDSAGTVASGHNYQLFKATPPSSIVNIEVAPRGLYSVRPVQDGSVFFHTNQYTTLQVPQLLSNSSTHRLERVGQLLKMHTPQNTSDLLSVLGDQADIQWPVYHDEKSHERGDLSDWTLCTALVDLREKRLRVFTGNPKFGHIVADEALF